MEVLRLPSRTLAQFSDGGRHGLANIESRSQAARSEELCFDSPPSRRDHTTSSVPDPVRTLHHRFEPVRVTRNHRTQIEHHQGAALQLTDAAEPAPQPGGRTGHQIAFDSEDDAASIEVDVDRQ
jgi:hypothetical protein